MIPTNCNGWKPTGEAKPDGRPIFECGLEPPCKAKVWGHNPGEHKHHKESSDTPQPLTDLTCEHRGGRAGKIAKAGCSTGCKIRVWECDCEDIASRLCTLSPSVGSIDGKEPQNCQTCPHRKPTIPNTAV